MRRGGREERRASERRGPPAKRRAAIDPDALTQAEEFDPRSTRRVPGAGSAADLPTAFAKAERAAGRPLPIAGTAFLSVRDADKRAVVDVAAILAGCLITMEPGPRGAKARALKAAP